MTDTENFDLNDWLDQKYKDNDSSIFEEFGYDD